MMKHSYLNSKCVLSIFLQIIVFYYMSTSLESTYTYGNETDLLALLDFKNRITHDPFGIMSSWNDTIDFCNWVGIKCDPSSKRVTILNLEAHNLAGSIPPSIGNLTYLTGINLMNNSFRGQIPQELGRLLHLRYLNFTYNSFSGKIPTNLSHCTELRALHFGCNELVGPIPDQLCSLSKLIHLRFGANYLTGNIPSWLGNFSSLYAILLARNHFHGNIPEDLGHLKNLGELVLWDNNFSGKVPYSIYNISSMYYFTVTKNQLYGELPPDIGITMPNLQVFAGGVNMFTGSLPFSLSNASRLEVLDFAQNGFSGSFPENLGSLRDLVRLNFDQNQLGYGKANDLNFINLLGNCSYLEVLGLGQNKFGGELPKSVANLSTTLRIFTIGSNLIHGSIPISLGKLVNLILLGFEGNYFSGSVPDIIGKLHKLEGLHLNVNQFSGLVPSSLGNLTSLTKLFMEENRFEGSIPHTIGNCKNLLILNLSSNNLSATIPKELIGLSSLSISLTLSNNSLSGSLPFEVGNLVNLAELDVSHNKLSGKIPSTLGSCISLERLHLEGNELEGTIPQSLQGLRGLEELDLSSNYFSGLVPDFFDKLSPLKHLNISNNNFEGELSSAGIFSNETAISVYGNTRLCGGIPELHLGGCPKGNILVLKFVIPIACAIVVCLILGVGIFVTYLMAKHSKMKKLTEFSHKDGLLALSYTKIRESTDDFSVENLIGSGHFGSVYKGKLFGDGEVVAIKILNLQQQGAAKSFVDECNALRSIRHRNLLKIITSCSSIDQQGNEFKSLIFEFMPNGSLDQWLHPRSAEQSNHMKRMNFIQRLDIAIDVASALDYLHHHCETPIVHCDLKPSNVLLDQDMVAHVGDFGLARFLFEASENLPRNETTSVGLKGSIGYIPPEYGVGGQVSILGDSYSYGILLLEMFTGKRPTDDMFKDGVCNIHHYVTMALPDKVMDIVDPLLLFEDNDSEVVDDLKSNENEIEMPMMIEKESGQVNARRRMKECLVTIMHIGVMCSQVQPTERMMMGVVFNKMNAARDSFLKHKS